MGRHAKILEIKSLADIFNRRVRSITKASDQEIRLELSGDVNLTIRAVSGGEDEEPELRVFCTKVVKVTKEEEYEVES